MSSLIRNVSRISNFNQLTGGKCHPHHKIFDLVCVSALLFLVDYKAGGGAKNNLQVTLT